MCSRQESDRLGTENLVSDRHQVNSDDMRVREYIDPDYIRFRMDFIVYFFF